MWIEYMVVENKAEAQELLKACTDMNPTEKDEIYIVKEKEDFFAILKIKKFHKKHKEQKWTLQIGEKGIRAERFSKKEYISEWSMTILLFFLCVGFALASFILSEFRIIFIWICLLFLFFFMFYSWKKLFKPAVSLKIFLVRLL